jgi:flagellar basal-body rod protein FlgB
MAPEVSGSVQGMPINDLPILSALRTRMQWHQERQRVLAENISNSDTPNFRPRDLVEPKFDRNGATVGGGMGTLPMARTSATHIAASGAVDSFDNDRGRSGFQTRPAGNAVNLRCPPTRWTMRRRPRSTAAALACSRPRSANADATGLDQGIRSWPRMEVISPAR